MKVNDILRVKGSTLFTVKPDELLASALNAMAEKDIGSLVVMSHGQLVGMLTFREVIQQVVKNGGQVGSTTVQDAMDAQPLTCTSETDLDDVRRIMLASAPGSQHILGLAMVSEFFRAEGWQVVVEISTTEKALLHAVSHEWFDVIGLSVGLVEQLPHIPALMANLKNASRNPNTCVILGGPALLDADNHAKVGQADGISISAPEAVKLAGDLLKNR